MAGGRPTKYDDKYCRMIIEHFDIKPTKQVDDIYTYKDGTQRVKKIEVPAAFPTFQDFAHKINVNGDTLVEWSNTYPEFSAAYARAKQLQHHIWLTNGMSGLYNAQFAQFFGKNCLGYKDKQEHEMTGANGGPIETKSNINLTNLSNDDLKTLESILLKTDQNNNQETSGKG